MLGNRLVIVSHALLVCYLIGLLSLPRVPSTLAALVCLTGIAASSGHWMRDARRSWAPMAVFAVPALAYCSLMLAQMVTGLAPTRLASFLLIVLLALALGLSGTPSRAGDVRRWVLPAAAIGAIGAFAIAVYQVHVLGYLRPYGWLGVGPTGNGAIKFGDLAATFGLLSLVLALTAAQRGRRILGLVGLACGMATLALTQARGGVLGVLVALFALVLALKLRRYADARRVGRTVATVSDRTVASHRPKGGSLAVAALVVIALVGMFAFMQQRFAEIEPSIGRFQQGDADSQTGQRLALWQAAIRAGLRRPLTGAGFERFGAELDRQVASGEIPPTIRIHYQKAHNEYLEGLAAAGFPGLAATVLLFLVTPVAMVLRIARGRDSPAVMAALVTSSAFAGFALTDGMFDRQITIVAFHLLIAWFLGAAVADPGRPDAKASS